MTQSHPSCCSGVLMTPLGFFGHGVRDGGNSLSRFPLSKLKLDNFFLLWLAAPDSQKLVRVIIIHIAAADDWHRLTLHIPVAHASLVITTCRFYRCWRMPSLVTRFLDRRAASIACRHLAWPYRRCLLAKGLMPILLMVLLPTMHAAGNFIYVRRCMCWLVVVWDDNVSAAVYLQPPLSPIKARTQASPAVPTRRLEHQTLLRQVHCCEHYPDIFLQHPH